MQITTWVSHMKHIDNIKIKISLKMFFLSHEILCCNQSSHSWLVDGYKENREFTALDTISFPRAPGALNATRRML